MSISMGVISLILVLAVFGPFFLAATFGNSEKRKWKQNINQTVRKLDLKLSHKEHWSDLFIGIDRERGSLLHMQRGTDGRIIIQQLALSGLQRCEIRREERNQRVQERTEQILQRLELELGFGGKRSPARLLFYQKSDLYAENYEQRRIERWRDLILKYAVPQRPLKTAA